MQKGILVVTARSYCDKLKQEHKFSEGVNDYITNGDDKK
jgi:hypothetical protein